MPGPVAAQVLWQIPHVMPRPSLVSVKASGTKGPAAIGISYLAEKMPGMATITGFININPVITNGMVYPFGSIISSPQGRNHMIFCDQYSGGHHRTDRVSLSNP